MADTRTHPDADDGPATAALAALEPFVRRLLPAQLHRHAQRRRLPPGDRRELLDDLHQELRLDCLLHPTAIAALDERERHQRWFRLAERWLYRQRRRGEEVAEDLDWLAGGAAVGDAPAPEASAALLPAAVHRRLVAVQRRSERHRNGRCNLTATAARLGLGRRELRGLWAEVASHLGYDDAFLAFWQRRLAEALCGLAADLLRDQGALCLLPRARALPDPEGRLRRIRRIRAALSVRPVPFALRRMLAQVLRRRSAPTPAGLLAAAAALHPSGTVRLWQFEAAVLERDWADAARALRAARVAGCGDDLAVALVLARARLLQVRGRDDAALQLLRRASDRRAGREPRLRRALTALRCAPGG
ncbi:MAG: hypothetical protein AB7O97_13140 [Planctomycetota bacterium]